jgi:hypothetical protein
MVKQILIRSVNRLSGGGFHEETGHGQLNAPAALRLLDSMLGRMS